MRCRPTKREWCRWKGPEEQEETRGLLQGVSFRRVNHDVTVKRSTQSLFAMCFPTRERNGQLKAADFCKRIPPESPRLRQNQQKCSVSRKWRESVEHLHSRLPNFIFHWERLGSGRHNKFKKRVKRDNVGYPIPCYTNSKGEENLRKDVVAKKYT